MKLDPMIVAGHKYADPASRAATTSGNPVIVVTFVLS